MSTRTIKEYAAREAAINREMARLRLARAVREYDDAVAEDEAFQQIVARAAVRRYTRRQRP